MDVLLQFPNPPSSSLPASRGWNTGSLASCHAVSGWKSVHALRSDGCFGLEKPQPSGLNQFFSPAPLVLFFPLVFHLLTFGNWCFICCVMQFAAVSVGFQPLSVTTLSRRRICDAGDTGASVRMGTGSFILTWFPLQIDSPWG